MNNTLNRPLFRNMGGPAAMMPQDMMAPPQMAPNNPEEQLMQVEQTAEAEGRAYVENVMGGIDAAEDVTSMINALRGNEAPLESRYAELAGYVGEVDAGKTPESVLAMVQPTLMMTEEGAIDSGIGELMSKMAESEMETPQGDPTAMGQGVGELMTMGAGSTPPVNFRQGGEVQYFAPGGSVISNAQKMAPEYEKYFAGAMDSEARAADLEEQKRLSQAQIFFDIAQTALAAGAPTDTPMSAAERIAGAVGQTQLFDKMGQRSAGLLQAKQAQAAEDRQMRMAGLTASLTQSQTDEQNRQDLELARAKSTASKPVSLAPGAQLFSADGKLLATNSTVTPKTTTLSAGQSVFDAQGKLIASMPAKPVTYSLSAGQAAYDADGKLIVERADKPQVINLAPGAIAYDGNGVEIARGAAKPAVTHLLGKDQQLVGADGHVIAKGKETKETVTLGPGQQVVNVADGSVIAKGPAKFEAITMYSVVDGKVKKESVNVGTPEGLARAEELQADGFVPDNDEAMAFINDAIAEDKEKRGVEIKKAEEDRATARETVVYGRNRADELADIDAKVASTIATEERAEGRTLTAEERDQITWKTRNTITTQNDLDRLKIAQGLSDTSQIAAEDRKAIVDQNKFDEEQAAKYDAEQRAIADRDTIELRQVNGELVRVDTLTGETTVLFGEPKVPDYSPAQVTLRNADGVPVTTVIDVTSPKGKAVIEQVNAANAAAPGSASFEKVPTASTAVRGFLVPGEGVFTSYDGKTYVDEDGNAKPLPGGAFEVSSTIAYEVAKTEKMAAGAQAQLDAMDIELVQGMTKIDGSPISRADMAEVKDAFAASRKGTGFWSKVYAGLDAVAGGLAPEAFGELFKDTTDARQFVKMVRVMGRSALASSPRFAVADLQTVEQLFPNEQTLFASPKTETRKLNDIVGYLTEEKVRILELFAGGSPMDSTMKSTLNQKLFEIDRLESILGPVAMLGQASENAGAVTGAIDAMKAARQRAKDAKKGPP